MARHLTARRALAALALFSALAGIACGGGSTKSTSTSTPAAPGANVDPNANGVYTGPINKAKATANDANARQQQMDQGALDK